MRDAAVKHKTMLLEVKDLKVEFHRAEKISYAVRGVSFNMEKGEILGIVGESGSGKSTMGLTMMGLLPSYASIPDRYSLMEKT